MQSIPSKKIYKAFKFQFDVIVEKIELNISFPCQLYVVWRRGAQKIETKTKANLDITKFQALFDEKLSMVATLQFDETKSVFIEKKSSFTAIIITAKGNKIAGIANFDLSSYINNKINEKTDKLRLEKCPDKNAKICITCKINFLGEVKDADLISQNTSRFDEDFEEMDVDQMNEDNKKKISISPDKIQLEKEEAIKNMSPKSVPKLEEKKIVFNAANIDELKSAGASGLGEKPEDIKKLQNKIENLSKELENLNYQKKEYEIEIERIKKNFEAQQTLSMENFKIVENEMKKWKNETDEISKKERESSLILKREIEKSQKLEKSLILKNEEFEKLKLDLNLKVNNITDLENNLEKKNSEINKIISEFNLQEKKLKINLENSNKIIKDLENQNLILTQQFNNHNLEKENNETEIITKLNVYQNENNTLMNTIALKVEEIENLKHINKDFISLKNEYNINLQKNEEKDIEIFNLKNELNQKNQYLNEKENVINELKKDTDIQKNNLEYLKNENSKILQMNQNIEIEFNSKKDEITEKEKIINDLKKDLNLQKNSFESLKSEYNKILQKNEEKETELNKIKIDLNDKIQRIIMEKENIINELKQENLKIINEKENELAIQKNLLEKLLIDKLKIEEDKINELKQQLNNETNEKNILINDLNNLKQENKKLENEIINSKLFIEELNNKQIELENTYKLEIKKQSQYFETEKITLLNSLEKQNSESIQIEILTNEINSIQLKLENSQKTLDDEKNKFKIQLNEEKNKFLQEFETYKVVQEKNIETLQSKNKNLELEIEILTNEIHSLELKLENSNQTLETESNIFKIQLEEEKNKYFKEFEDYKINQEKNLQILLSKNQNLEFELKSNNEKNLALIKELENKLQFQEKTNEDYQIYIATLETNEKQLKDILETSKNQSELEKINKKENISELEILKNKNIELENHYKTEISEKEKIISDLSNKLKISDQNNILLNQSIQMKEASNENEKEKIIIDLNNEINEMKEILLISENNIKVQRQTYSKQINENQEKIRDLMDQCINFQNEVERLNNSINILTQENLLLENDKTELNNKLSLLQKETAKNDDNYIEKKQFSEKIQTIEEENEFLNTQIALKMKELSNIEKKNSEFHKENESNNDGVKIGLYNQLEMCESIDKVEVLTSELNRLRNNEIKLKEIINERQKQIEDLSNSEILVQNLKEKLEEYINENNLLKTTLQSESQNNPEQNLKESTNNDVQKLVSEISSLHYQLELRDCEKSSLEQQLNGMTKEFDHLLGLAKNKFSPEEIAKFETRFCRFKPNLNEKSGFFDTSNFSPDLNEMKEMIVKINNNVNYEEEINRIKAEEFEKNQLIDELENNKNQKEKEIIQLKNIIEENKHVIEHSEKTIKNLENDFIKAKLNWAKNDEDSEKLQLEMRKSSFQINKIKDLELRLTQLEHELVINKQRLGDAINAALEFGGPDLADKITCAMMKL